MSTSANTKKPTKNKKADEEEEINVDGLLDELKANIIKVYANIPNSGKDLKEMAGKNPINILHEIELDINTNIRTIDYIFRGPN